ncbi:iron complex outermembrane recepter protein [Porphyromonadaceae bacterium KH3R12]|nr:iron complex outermembrane recepter protein [Porphyromonadaceae bacterium KH3R12]SFL03502.1 iron complex outermembrane recepter protein [Porphyromonadaceae bacterium KH3CP3RA]
MDTQSLIAIKTLFFFLGFLFIVNLSVFAQQNSTFKGKVYDNNNRILVGATVFIEQLGIGDDTDWDGNFEIDRVPAGQYKVVVSYVGFESIEREIEFQEGMTKEINFRLLPDRNILSEIEVFGARRERPEKMDALTRIPLRLDEQVQSISVISHKMIAEQGALTLNDAVRNAPGLTTFATYGNTSESLTSRGYRGIPVVKNGVRIHSDFRGQGFLTDWKWITCTIPVLPTREL